MFTIACLPIYHLQLVLNAGPEEQREKNNKALYPSLGTANTGFPPPNRICFTVLFPKCLFLNFRMV